MSNLKKRETLENNNIDINVFDCKSENHVNKKLVWINDWEISILTIRFFVKLTGG